MSYNTYPSPSVSGPSSSTDKAVARWDGTAGSALQDSSVTVDDSGNVTANSVRLLSNDGVHYTELGAAASQLSSLSLKFPVDTGTPGQAMKLGGDSQTFVWFTPFTASTFTDYKAQNPMKYWASAASTANIDMSAGNPGTIDGVDFTFGGRVLLKNQTDPTENGLWFVDIIGAWSRDTTMPDNSTSTLGAIVPIIPGGTTNGSTIWFSTSTGDGNVSFVKMFP